MSANPHANGGLLLRDLRLLDFHDYAVAIQQPGAVDAEATRVQGEFIRDVIQGNSDNLRVFSPDETTSNRWGAVFEVTNRCSPRRSFPPTATSPDGRVMEMLSEHQCEGWLEGYLLTGRHGFFSCDEAFIHVIDSMFNQHAKWLKVSNQIPWRRPIASLNYLPTSHVWRQDHNGFSYQDPGFIDVVANKNADIIRICLPLSGERDARNCSNASTSRSLALRRQTVDPSRTTTSVVATSFGHTAASAKGRGYRALVRPNFSMR